MVVFTQHRTPYVGSGEDGARRSARIDREEADTVSVMSERWDQLMASAAAWEDQAYDLVCDRLGRRPTLDDVRRIVGGEDWLAGLALVDLSDALRGDLERYTEWSKHDGRYTYEGEDRVSTFHPTPIVNWEEWVSSVDTDGRGWSTNEWRLFNVVASVVISGRQISLRDSLYNLGSWEEAVWTILVAWASGGNNRDIPGALTVIARN